MSIAFNTCKEVPGHHLVLSEPLHDVCALLQGYRAGEAFSGLGLTIASPSKAVYTYYIEQAFINATVAFLLISFLPDLS